MFCICCVGVCWCLPQESSFQKAVRLVHYLWYSLMMMIFLFYYFPILFLLFIVHHWCLEMKTCTYTCTCILCMPRPMGLPTLFSFFLMSGCSNPIEEALHPKSKLILICEHFHSQNNIYVWLHHKCITLKNSPTNLMKEYRDESMKMSLQMLHPQLLMTEYQHEKISMKLMLHLAPLSACLKGRLNELSNPLV